MKTILISESKLDELFEKLLKDLDLTKLKEHYMKTPSMELADSMHRRFIYDICQLKEAIKNA